MKFLFLRLSFPLESLCAGAYPRPAIVPKNGVSMLDLMFVAIGLASLAGAMLYAAACDRL
jgi:hypothetical protein